MIKRAIVFLTVVFMALPSYAATVYLKSGQVLQGEIIEQTERSLTLNVYNVPLTYYQEEIIRVEEDGPAVSAVQPSAAIQPFDSLLTRENIEAAFTIRPQAQENAPFGYVVSGKPQEQKTFLWSLRSGNSTVYLLGSIHLLKEEFFPLHEKIEQAFEESDTLVTEVDITKSDQLMMQPSVMAEAIYQGDDSLKAHIAPELYQRVEKKLTAMGLDIAMFKQFKPWFIAMQMTATELIKLGFDPAFGIDKYFLDKAQGEKRILELESYDFQIKLLSGFSDQQQELFLRSAVMDLDTIEREMDSFIKAWLSGDSGRLQDLLLGNLKKSPELAPVFEKIFFERNATMAAKIETLIKNGGSYFVIVGAGHLVGAQGIIQLLKDKGYSISQI